MTPIRQAISWWCFVPEKLSPEATLKAAVDIGYEAIELVEPQYWQMIKDHGLKIASINGHRPIEDGLNKRENRDRIAKELQGNIKEAMKWGIPNLICFSGNRNGLDDNTGAEITAENLRYMAKMAEDAGITLILELLNSKVDHPDYQCDTTPWGVKVMEMVGSPRVKLLYDIYHMQIMEGDIIATIRKYHQHFGHYHTGGNPGRAEIDETQELYYPPIVQAIVDTGYTGYLGQEFIPAHDPVKGLQRAFDICNVG